MTPLKAGDKAPDFIATDQEGNPIALKDFKGNKLVLFFYPKDNTPGCTSESCNLRDNYAQFLESGYKIVGISADDEKSHKNFISKNMLPFPLIPDKGKNIIKSYGVWGKKKLYGKEYEGINRMTFIISQTGIIEKIISKVDTKNHAAQIFSAE